MVKGKGADSSSLKLNLIGPCRAVRASTTVEGCQAGRLGQLFQYLRKYNAESLKQGSKRFNSNAKTNYIADLGIIYLWGTHTTDHSM